MCVGLTIMSCFIFKPVDDSLHFAWIYNYFKDAITFENILEYLILNFLIKLVYFKSHMGISACFLFRFILPALLLLFHSFCLFWIFSISHIKVWTWNNNSNMEKNQVTQWKCFYLHFWTSCFYLYNLF